MEGKLGLVVFHVMMLALLSSPLAASALHPVLPLQGKQAIASSGQVFCCNNCRYMPRTGQYMCEDRTEMEFGCREGCYNCRCDPMRYPSCVCGDQLNRCPPPCGRSSDDARSVPALGSKEQLLHA